MKIILDSTTKFVDVNGVRTRIWEGRSESGIPMIAFVVRVAIARGDDASQFERELQECRIPTPDVAAIPARLLID